MSFSAPQKLSKSQVHKRVFRRNLRGGGKGGFGLGRFPLRLQRQCQVHRRFGVRGVQLQGLAKTLAGLVQLSRRLQERAQVVVSVGRFGIQLDRLAIGRGRLAGLAQRR